MEETNVSLGNVDREKVKTAIRLHAPIEITSYTIPRQMELYIHDVLSLFLSECHQEHMDSSLSFVLGELLSNSKKANTKRIYFKEKNLDINNKEDYALGMKTFKEDTMANLSYYLTEQKKAGLYVKLCMQLLDDCISIQIRNNSTLCPTEQERINDKLEKVKQYNNANEVYTNILDQSEGAGLGIIIIILMLKKIGLSKDSFKVYVENNETITSIVLPLNEEVQKEVVTFYEDFAKEQKTIPVFTNQIKQIEYLFNHNEATKEKLLEVISKDVTLAALLIKEAAKKDNSCCNLEGALDLVGIETLKSLYSKENPEVNIVKADMDVSDFWNHSYKVAFCAYNLAKNLELTEGFSAEDIYLAALLHDIECVLIEAVVKSTNGSKERFRDHYKELNISDKVLHMIYENGWHSMGGYLLTQQWNLNSKISDLIKNYKNPGFAPEEIRKTCAILYVADMIQYYDDEKIQYYQLDKNLLSLVGIESENQLKFIIGKIKSAI